MRVSVVPVLQDNYSYVLICEATKKAAAIDPVEPAKVLAQAEKDGVEIVAVITTHHHLDHAGGNEQFVQMKPGVPVYGGGKSVAAVTHVVAHGDEFRVGDLKVKAIATPCHTAESTCFLVSGEPDVIFTGDTLFTAGCGRFFEGSADQMVHNMQTFSKLKPDTRVYSGHEYTVGNLKFAHSVDPSNSGVPEKLKWSQQQVAAGLPTIPSTIAEEIALNPFMRFGTPEMKAASGKTDPADVMSALREMKNGFKPNL